VSEKSRDIRPAQFHRRAPTAVRRSVEAEKLFDPSFVLLARRASQMGQAAGTIESFKQLHAIISG